MNQVSVLNFQKEKAFAADNNLTRDFVKSDA